MSWALTAFSITIGALIVPGGWAADRYGRARMFATGFAVFLLGSGLVALAPTVELLVAARIVQAAGVAFQGPAMLALMLDAFGPDRRATAVGVTGGWAESLRRPDRRSAGRWSSRSAGDGPSRPTSPSA